MSFILDALKKAESERSRQAGPALMHVRVVTRQRRLPPWAWILGAVLLANLLLLGWLLLRKPAPAPAEVMAAVPAPPPPQPSMQTSPPVLAPASIPALVAPPIPVAATEPAIVSPVAMPTSDSGRLPTMQEVVAGGMALPTLQLNLHVYDEAPANRYVLLNARRMREGDELPDGIRLEQITAQGVVLSAHGRRFLLIAGS